MPSWVLLRVRCSPESCCTYLVSIHERSCPCGANTELLTFGLTDRIAGRIALFFSAASLSGAFSGLLAAGIQNMDGLGGKPGWAWIFIIVSSLSNIIRAQ